MFNVVKVLELTLNNGVCLITGQRPGIDTGNLEDYESWEQLEGAFSRQINYYMDRMMECCYGVERIHQEMLPSPFLSCVIDDCIEKGVDVTAGGARYNLSGIQLIQAANLADCLAAIKKLVYEDGAVSRKELLDAMRRNYEGYLPLRKIMQNDAPKYGNDSDYVDDLGAKWVEYFAEKLSAYKNYRGGRCHTGLYTVSAHVPMGQNVGASADGRLSGQPLADGGLSPVYGRDRNGPTAVLNSVSKINPNCGSNGALLNMKFLPVFFKTEENIGKFAGLLRALVSLKIIHAQFNVVDKDELVRAQKNPEEYASLTIRVAGYTAYFTELANDLQNEIIERTSYGDGKIT